jgi:histidinol-phosphate/aromatic aminotransferase/cobyric acid decarboxylase-like protein/choline kinase
VKAIILSAGLGMRLMPLTREIPKCLLEINGKTILENCLDNLHFCGIKEIVIVVGHLKELIMAKIGNTYKDMSIKYIFAKEYETTNNIVSLWYAREELNEDLFLIESDIMFKSKLLPEVKSTYFGRSIAVIGNYLPEMTGSTLKISYVPESKSEIILKWDQINHQNNTIVYKTVNIYYLNKAFLKILKSLLQAHIDAGLTQEYYEAVFAEIIKNPKFPQLHHFYTDDWAEVDNIEDFKKAQYKFSDNKYKILSEMYGQWPSTVTDHCHLYNVNFPPKEMMDYFKTNIKRLIGTYPSGQREIAYYLSEWLGINPDYLVVGNGASELIKIIGRESEGICVSTPSFNEFEECSQQINKVPLDPETWKFDKNKFLYNLNNKYCEYNGVIVTPNNPTSLAVPVEDIYYVLKNTYRQVIVDESFIDFSDNSSMLEKLDEYPNLIVLKSLGKILGVCGVRLGFLASKNKEFIQGIRRHLPIWNINNFAETIVRQISRYEKQFKLSCKETKIHRDDLYKHLSCDKNLQVWKPDGNFILCKILSNKDGIEVCREMLEKYNILIKHCANKTMDEGNKYIRIGCRTAQENTNLSKYLKKILQD